MSHKDSTRQIIGKPTPKRSRLDLLADILKNLSSESLTLNGVVHKTKMNMKLAKRCLQELLRKGLISERTGERYRLYGVTDQGIVWLKLYEEVSMK